ncbi:MAG: GDP-mannose 4,6-dehydratase [Pseudobdellovibrionaceae bacterium]|nr:MAG: GDP-mannose 4,6-dehydratase [Pseudobdellovibrionaceae bacterium]
MKVMVTGASGFVGAHLLHRLGEMPGVSVVAMAHDVADSKSSAALKWLSLDITNKGQVRSAVSEYKPNVIFHLAAQSHVPTSFAHPEATFQVNIFGTLNVLEAVKSEAPECTVINVGSAAIYGKTFKSGKSIDEDGALEPLNPYGVSKAASDLLAGQYAASSSVKTIRLRPLNHIGPGQSVDFVVPSFVTQLLEIKKSGGKGILKVGDLSPERDFLDVRDVVDAYVTIMTKRDQIASGEVFNICSGQSFKIETVLKTLIDLIGVDVEVVVDPDRLRPVDMPIVSCSSDKLREQLHWTPRYSLEQSLKDIIESMEGHRGQGQ